MIALCMNRFQSNEAAVGKIALSTMCRV